MNERRIVKGTSKAIKGAYYSYQAKVYSDKTCEIVALFKKKPIEAALMNKSLLKEYLAIKTLIERREFLFDLNIFKLKDLASHTIPHTIELNVDAIFYAVNEALCESGTYKMTAAEKRERALKIKY